MKRTPLDHAMAAEAAAKKAHRKAIASYDRARERHHAAKRRLLDAYAAAVEAVKATRAAAIAAGAMPRESSGRPPLELLGQRSGRQRDGILEVVRYLRPGANGKGCGEAPSPWWLARCRSCKAEHPYQGHRLRNYRPSCRSCGAA